ncbi:MAG: tol-pal system YbgF family protein [Saprospiraceae bacterium]
MEKDLEKEYERIGRFFAFEMNEAERTAFEQEVENDVVLAERTQRFETVENIVDNQFGSAEVTEQQRVKAAWKNVENVEKVAKVRSLRPKWQQWSLAAAAVVLLGVGLWWYTDSLENPQQMALDYWEQTSIQNAVTLRSDTDILPSQIQLQKTIEAYQAQQHQTALTLAAQADPNTPQYPQILLVRGQSFFALNQMPNAISEYQKIIDLENGGAKDLAYWLQALAYVRTNEIEKAQQNLRLIIEEKYAFAPQAAKLLEKLNVD